MEKLLIDFCAINNIECGAERLSQLSMFYEKLIEVNEQFNLTAITEKRQVYIKHFIDSLLGIKFFPQNATVIDVGAGAGFPSIVLKIFRPDLNITMLDSLNKRVGFLNEVVEVLHLKNCSAVHGRAEEIGRTAKFREQFDVATARAVAKLATLTEYVLPFVKKGGSFVAYKGICDEEVAEAQKAISTLGGKLRLVEKMSLPEIADNRSIVIMDKISATPILYPRVGNKPKTQPL